MQEVDCWVPNCTASKKSQKMFALPDNPKSREIWLALAGKPVKSAEDIICFCSSHFAATEIFKIDNSYLINSLPFKQMPEMICRLCLSIIQHDNPQVDSVHILSNNILTEMPPCIEDMLSYFVSSDPEPLLKIITSCISGLDVQCNPPPLVCRDCFLNAWLLYMFKLSSINVEKTLKEDIPLESYIRMMLCRCCPVRSGTNFSVIPEDSGKGQLLRKIFGEDGNQTNVIPLRLCRKCDEIASKLEAFYKTCLIAEAKIRRHMELERNDARRRNTLNDFRRIQVSRQTDVSELLNSDRKTENSAQVVPMEGLAKRLSVDTAEKTQISLSQWMKETLAKSIITHAHSLKNAIDEDEILKTWSVIRGEMVKNGVTLEIPAMMNIWAEMLTITKTKRQLKLPMDYLDQLMVHYFSEEEQTSYDDSLVPGSSLRTLNTLNLPDVNNTEIQHMDMASPSCSFHNPSHNRGPPVLSPQVKRQTIVRSHRRGGAHKDLFWDESMKLRILELIEKEALRLKDLREQKPSLRQVTINVVSKYPEFQKYTAAAIYSRIFLWKKNLDNGLSANSKHAEVLKRVMSFLINKKTFTKSSGTQNKKTKLVPKLPRKSFTQEEQLALAIEMSKELRMMKDYNQLKRQSPWHIILSRLHKRHFLNMNLERLTALWSKIKTSAKIHSKDGGDEVDTEVWNLLQTFQNHIETKSRNNSENNDVVSTSKADDQNSRECMVDSTTKVTNYQNTSDNENPRNVDDVYSVTDSSDNQDSMDCANNQEVRVCTNQQDDPVTIDKENSRISAEKQVSGGSGDKQDSTVSVKNENIGNNTTITKCNKDRKTTSRYEDSGSDYEPNDSEVDDNDDKFEEEIEVKHQVKMENPSKFNETLISRNLDFDKFKFVKAMKREFKEICRRREAGLHHPFNKILNRLSEKEYSKFGSQVLKNKWRNMKFIAVAHQKKGHLTKLDRAVLGLINYKNEKGTYDDKNNSFSEESDQDTNDSSSDEADGEDSECDDKQNPLNITELLLENKPFLKTVKKKLKHIFREEPCKLKPFHAVFQQLSNNTKEFDLLREKWQKLREVAYDNRKVQQTTDVDDQVLKLLMLSKSQKTQYTIAGIVNTSEADSTNMENDFLPKIDPKILIKFILREFNEIIREKQHFKFPISEAFCRLNKKEYSIYRLNEIERHWANISQNAYKHRKLKNMNEVDEIFFDIINKSREYRKSKTDKISSDELQDCNENSTKQKIMKGEYSQPSTSAKKRDGTSKKSRRRHWSEEDMLRLFKLIKQEYNEWLKTRVPLPSHPWTTIIKNIAEKKLFKCSEEKELNHLWLKMRRDFTNHENTPDMTNLDWKVSRLLQNHMANKGIIIKEKEPVVPKQRPRPKFVAESDNEDTNETVISKGDKSDKLKFDLIKVMRQFGREAFVRDPDTNHSFWMKVKLELKTLGHRESVEALQSSWDKMVVRAKRAMADQTESNEIDRCLIQFMEEVMRLKNEKEGEKTDREECTREDLKVEPVSDTEPQNTNDEEGDEAPPNSQKSSLNSEHISLRDLEKKDISQDVSKKSGDDAIDANSDDSSDTVEYPFSKEVFEQTEIGESEKRSTGGTSIIDLCSDKELDELLSDVEDNEHPWKI